MVRHLREQLASAEVERERHASLRVRELVLETQIGELKDELHEAKTYHTPVSITFARAQSQNPLLHSVFHSRSLFYIHVT